MVHRVPKEPWTASPDSTKVAVGPKGLVVGGIICYGGHCPSLALSPWLLSSTSFTGPVQTLLRVYLVDDFLDDNHISGHL